MTAALLGPGVGGAKPRPLVLAAVLFFFTSAGVVTAVLRENAWYLLLFVTVGGLSVAAVALERAAQSARRRRAVRIGTMWAFALLFGWLMAAKAVNFQLPQVLFDFSAGAASGALIQLVVARLLAPFAFGNAFCSRACWNGALFELLHRTPPGRAPPGMGVVRWAYFGLAVLEPLLLVRFGFTTTESEATRRAWIIGENLFIFAVGLALLPLWGSRAYCRHLCPQLTISRVIAPLSLLKIAGDASRCTRCGACEAECPMGVPILSYIHAGLRVAARDCILCGRCTESCPSHVLELSFRRR